MPNYGFGRLPATDDRNDLHPMARKLGGPLVPIPSSKTWAFRGDVLDQGATGTCGGHAGAHFVHAAPITHKVFIDPFELYREAVLLDEYQDNDGDATCQTAGCQAGTSGTGVSKALDKRGMLSEYVWANVMREAIKWGLTRGPVMIGSNWYNGMMNPTREGFVKITPNTDTIAGGHLYVLRSFNTKQGIVEGLNSWGPRWNKAATKCRPGHFLMSFETLERLFHEQGDAVSAVEKKKRKA